jgi:hypothetical protein
MAQQHTPAAGSGKSTQRPRELPAGAKTIRIETVVEGDHAQTTAYVWDEAGRCFIADMQTQSLRPEQPSDTADALLHLWDMAQRTSSSEKVAARFLLGLYNGYRFPFDLTDLRLFDCANFKRAMLVLAMDHMPKAEVHVVLGDLLGRSGRDMGAAFEHLAYSLRLKGAAKKADLPELRAEVMA